MNLLRLPGIVWRRFLIRRRNEGPFPLVEILEKSLQTVALTDLGAFRNPTQKIPDGIETVVIMEDRSPEFFLGFQQYKPWDIVPLNRHGPIDGKWIQADLKRLVIDLHQQGKKVLIGFWGFWSDGISKPTPWLRKHPELKLRRRGESDIGNPFARLTWERISFADYAGLQYRKLHEAFSFDGLFFGDGLCGFRYFWNPRRYEDKAALAPAWGLFYENIAQQVHWAKGELWAYDCMGFSAEEALKHGANYALLAAAGLDKLVFQSYPTAWGRYFRIPGKQGGIRQETRNMQSVRDALGKTNIKLLYTAELGDSVEGWRPSHQITRWQMNALDCVADGRLLVWANDLLAVL